MPRTVPHAGPTAATVEAVVDVDRAHRARPGVQRAGGTRRRETVERFLAAHPEFVVDPDRERFMLTLNPGGYLQRVR